MTEVIGLVICIKSLEAVTAEERLDRLEKQGARTERSVNRLGVTAAKSAAKFAAVSAGVGALTALFVSGARVTAQFEQSISNLSAITGAAGKDLDLLRDKSKEFGKSTTLSAGEAAEAFQLVASAKPDLLENASALAEVTRNAITLAEATGEPLSDAANTLGSALNQFKKAQRTPTGLSRFLPPVLRKARQSSVRRLRR